MATQEGSDKAASEQIMDLNIRAAFVAPAGSVLLSADYKQV